MKFEAWGNEAVTTILCADTDVVTRAVSLSDCARHFFDYEAPTVEEGFLLHDLYMDTRPHSPERAIRYLREGCDALRLAFEVFGTEAEKWLKSLHPRLGRRAWDLLTAGDVEPVLVQLDGLASGAYA